MRIHGNAKSRAFRCIWAAEEAGLAYDWNPIANQPGLKDAIGGLNPNGKLPVLEDGALVLFESLAINLHIAAKAGPPFMPTGDDASRVLQWTLWAAAEMEPNIMQWAHNTYTRPPERRDSAAAAAGAEATSARLAVLEAHLGAGGPWLLGRDFTVADLNLAGTMYGPWLNGYDLGAFPRAKAWLEACLTRPAALKARKLREG